MSKFRKFLLPHRGNNFLPHVFSTPVVAIVLCLLVFTFPLLTELIQRIPTQFAAIYAGALVSYTNEERAEAARPELTSNVLLTEAAQLKADDMAAKGYFAHESPDGKTPWYWFEQVGYDYKYAAENLAVDFIDSKDVVDAWMYSPTHRENILRPELTEIGIATAEGMYQGEKTTFVVQMFGTPNDEPTVSVETPKSKTPEKSSDTTSTIVDTTRGNIQEQVAGAYENKNLLAAQALTSPKRAIVDVYTIFIATVAILLLLGVAIEYKRHHRGIWIAGGLLIVVAAFLAMFMTQSGEGLISMAAPSESHDSI